MTLSHDPLVLRRGLPGLAQKLAAGRPVNTAYLGGSITWGGGTDGGYRGLTTRWLRQQYPASPITEINAGIGGTGSDLGAFRVQADALAHRPNLLLVEFAVNDGNAPDETVLGAMEGIVRQALRDDPTRDLCFVYTIAQAGLESLQAGRLTPTMQAHERVAEHYGIPSINLAIDIADRLARGDIQWPEFSHDNCHPNEKGYAMYGQTMAAAMQRCLAVSPQGATGPAPLPPPVGPSPWEQATCRNVKDLIAAAGQPSGWSYRPLVNQGGWECFDGVLESNVPGAQSEVSFVFNESTAGIYYQLGPDTGNLLWSVDDAEFKLFKPFDRFALTCVRPHYSVLTQGLGPGPHRLRLRVSEDSDPRSTGTWTRLAYLLVK